MKHNKPLRTAMCLILIGSLSCCSVNRISLKESINNIHCTETVLYKSLSYNKYGIPVFEQKLDKKPGKQKSIYHIVCMDKNNKPLASYQVLIKDPADKANGKNVLKVIYKWTGAGFNIGIDMAKTAPPSSGRSIGEAVGQVIFAYIIIPVIGGVSGFIIGVFASIPAGFQELAKLGITAEECLMGYTTYSYDRQGRLVHMVNYAPTKQPKLLTSTNFYYKNQADKPFQFTNYSEIEKKKRVVVVKD